MHEDNAFLACSSRHNRGRMQCKKDGGVSRDGGRRKQLYSVLVSRWLS